MLRLVSTARTLLAIIAICLSVSPKQSLADEHKVAAKAAAVLAKHCGNCHNANERQSGFSAIDLASVLKGDDEGQLILPGNAADSRLIKLMTGELEPRMPPEEDFAKVPEADLKAVRNWINEGAPRSSNAMPLSARIEIPKIKPSDPQYHFTSAACGLARNSIVIGSQGSVVAMPLGSKKPLWRVSDLAGKVNSLRESPDGTLVVVAGGVAGLGGQALILDARTGQEKLRLEGHSDTIYCASLSPDQKILATGSYDRRILLWDAKTGEQLYELTGHNGAIYDLDFSPDGRLLATASADQTVKLWTVADGKRLETLSQPEGEMTCVRFSANGKSVYAGGADRQIRHWMIRFGDSATSPMLQTLFAHEGPILQLEVLKDGTLLSSGKDRSIKRWTANLQAEGSVFATNDLPVALGSLADSNQLFCVDISGNLQLAKWSTAASKNRSSPNRVPPTTTTQRSPEVAGNRNLQTAAIEFSDKQSINDCDTPETALDITLPATIEGRLYAEGQPKSTGDVDLYRFNAKQGQEWIFEVNAARSKSPVDSFIDILSAETGKPVLKTRLQAVRESYFTFRGKDSNNSDDFRLQNWEEMELDEYLYSSGEVTRLWLYPRGPDSGFKVYPGFGSRHTFFGSTAVSHALGEPAYIVRELQPDEQPLPNGLPVFPVYFENDDDPQRKRGRDSFLKFVAPTTGEYLLRVRDARGFSGEKFSYKIDARQPKPDYKLKISGNKMQLPTGSGREWRVEVERQDGMEDPIAIEIVDLPAGFQATNPIIIESGQNVALGAIYLAASASNNGSTTEGAKEGEPSTKKLALALRSRTIPASPGSPAIEKDLKEKLEIEIVEKTEPQISIRSAADPTQVLQELVIRPGETVAARVIVQRNGEKRRIGFGKDDAGRNLPHGSFVDKIGLNGLLIVESESERDMFITAAPKLRPGRRQFHLRSDTPGNPTSPPIWIRVEAAAN